MEPPSEVAPRSATASPREPLQVAGEAGLIAKLGPRTFSTIVLALLLINSASLVLRTIVGLIAFRDVGFPDSAILFNVKYLLETGHIYPDIDHTPYTLAGYGPLLYLLLAIPYALAVHLSLNPVVFCRLTILGAFIFCTVLLFRFSKIVCGSGLWARQSLSFALALSLFANWTVQIRGDLLAIGFSFAAIGLMLRPAEETRPLAAGLFAGAALLVKQTYLASAAAIFLVLLYRRRFRDLALWLAGFWLLGTGGYFFVWWREPLMIKTFAAFRHPLVDYRGALHLLQTVLAQPVVPFAIVGAVVVRVSDSTALQTWLTYTAFAWIVPLFTASQVGANVNHYWEPLLASTVLAGYGFEQLRHNARAVPYAATTLLMVLFLGSSFVATSLGQDWYFFRDSYDQLVNFRESNRQWHAFLAVIDGQRLLSTFPDVAVHSTIPEMPDPFLNAMLEREGTWRSATVEAQITAAQYNLIVIKPGQTNVDPATTFRGVGEWTSGIWKAIAKSYRPACRFESMDIWLPQSSPSPLLPQLLALGCAPLPH